MTRRGLGRGLEALLGPEAESTLETLPIEDISPNPFQPRQAPDEARLDELADSIRVHGLIQPLVVKPLTEGRFQLIAGERRWRAAQRAGLERVPVVIRDADDRQLLALAIIENVQREDLGPIEAAAAYRRLMDEFQLTQQAVAEVIGKSRASVANTVRLLGLPDDVKALVESGALSEGHARALLSLDSADDVSAMAARAAREGWSVRQTEVAARGKPARRTERQASSASAPDPNVADAVRRLEAALGTRVEIRRGGKSHQLVVYFYSDEELNALFERLTTG